MDPDVGPISLLQSCGRGSEGGGAISRRFLEAVPAFLAPGGWVLMALSNHQADEHDPRHAASHLGYAVTKVLDLEYNQSRNLIYAMQPQGLVS